MITVPNVELPRLNAHFLLSIDGLVMGDFSECTGLSAEISTEEYAEGGENRFAHQFPTRGSFPSLVLKRGTTASLELWTWFSEFRKSGHVAPRDGMVSLLGDVAGDRVPVRAWAFRRGWPVKMTGPDLNAQSPAIAVESIELVHHGLTVVE